jgi:hypothetical protein
MNDQLKRIIIYIGTKYCNINNILNNMIILYCHMMLLLFVYVLIIRYMYTLYIVKIQIIINTTGWTTKVC